MPRGYCVALEICHTRRLQTYGGKTMSNRFTQYILIAMALGIVMGTLVFNYFPTAGSRSPPTST